MQFGSPPQPGPGTQTHTPRRLFLKDVECRQGIQIVPDGVTICPAPISRDIGSQTRHRDLSCGGARQTPQQTFHTRLIMSSTACGSDLTQGGVTQFESNVCIGGQQPRPPTTARLYRQLPVPQRTSDTRELPLCPKVFQSDLPRRTSALPQSHGTHAHPCESSRPRVTPGIIGRHHRPGENELSGCLAGINFMPDHVPQIRGKLPLVDEQRRFPIQQRKRVVFDERSHLRSNIQSHRAVGVLQSGRGFTASSRPLQYDCPHACQEAFQACIKDPGQVFHESNLPHFAEISSGTLRRFHPALCGRRHRSRTHRTPHRPPAFPTGTPASQRHSACTRCQCRRSAESPPATRLAPSDNGFITIPGGFPPVPVSVAVASPPAFHSFPQLSTEFSTPRTEIVVGRG